MDGVHMGMLILRRLICLGAKLLRAFMGVSQYPCECRHAYFN
jgi:hypothetical protein